MALSAGLSLYHPAAMMLEGPHTGPLDGRKGEKMKDYLDIVFKLGLLALLAGFLYVQAQKADNGRYSYSRDADLEFITDSRTGIVYQGGYSMNHITGEEKLRK